MPLSSLMKTQLKGDKILHVIDAQISNITTQMALATEHVMNLCLASSSTTLQKKHVPFKICLRFKAIVKGNPPTITCQRNTEARNGRWDCHPASKTLRHYVTCQVRYHVSKTLVANQALSSTNLWYTSVVFTTIIDCPIPNDQSFHGSSTIVEISSSTRFSHLVNHVT